MFNDMTHEHHYLPICFCEQVQNEQTKFWFLVPSPDLEGKSRALYPQTSFDDMNILIDAIHLYNHKLTSTWLKCSLRRIVDLLQRIGKKFTTSFKVSRNSRVILLAA